MVLSLNAPSTNAGSGAPRAAVLVVDDDTGTLETTALLLKCHGLCVYEAATGSGAVKAARSRSFDLALIDWHLPDMTGLDVVDVLRSEHICFPWILMSGFMDFQLALEAGKRGALRAVECGFDVEGVVESALAEITKSSSHGWPRRPLHTELLDARSAAERCANFILRACDATEDPHTLRDWASIVAVGYSTLAESCRVAGVQPHDARDFMRILRVLIATGGQPTNLEAHLQFGDSRTLRSLRERSGLSDARVGHTVSLDAFIVSQHFIPSDHPVLAAIRTAINRVAPRPHHKQT